MTRVDGAVVIVVGLGETEAITALLVDLQASDPRLRWRAAASLARVRTLEVAQALAGALYDPEPFVRWSAAQALAEVAGRATDRAVPVAVGQGVLEAAEAADAGARAAAADAIAAWGRQGPLEPALVLARDAEPSVRAAAVRALGRAGSETPQVVMPSLLRALDDPDPEVRRLAAVAIAWCRDEAASSALAARLGDPVGIVRAAALRALARLSSGEHEGEVLRLLGDRDLAARVEAIRFLRLRGGAGSLEPLAALEGDATEVSNATVGALAHDARSHIARRLQPWRRLFRCWGRRGSL